MGRRVSWWMIVGISLALNGCGGGRTAEPGRPPAGGTVTKLAVDDTRETEETLEMTLFEAPLAATPGDMEPAEIETVPLSLAETRRLLERVARPAAEVAWPEPFFLSPESPPPPRAGEVVAHPFPPDSDSAPPARSTEKGLRVLRYAPEGRVSVAPHLSVTFSRPMVALDAHAAVAEQVPISLSPMPKGTWRWIGTQTILFAPEGRFPAATDYRVRIPGDTRSLDGEQLLRTVAFSFSTPPLGIVAASPDTNAPQERQPLIIVAFNQRIQPEAVSSFIEIRVRSRRFSHAVVGRDDPLAVEARRSPRFRGVDAERLLVIRPTEPLPTGTVFDVVLRAGAPSAEGPRKTLEPSSFSFRTYESLKVASSRCGGRAGCPPGAPWIIELNNGLDEDAFDPEAVRVAPPVPGVSVRAVGRRIYVNGLADGRRTYTVTLPAQLTDRFGQRLGEEARVAFDVGPAEKMFSGPQEIVTLDPSGAPQVPIHTVNHAGLHVVIRRTSPADFHAYQTAAANGPTMDAPALGAPLFDGVLPVSGAPDAVAETRIDLSPYLTGGVGQFWVTVTPTDPEDAAHPPVSRFWAQATRLGVTAFSDDDTVAAWVTALSSGRPVPDAALELIGEAETLRARADESGLARFSLRGSGGSFHTLVARQGEDAAVLSGAPAAWGSSGWRAVTAKDEVMWYVFDDRGTYRPGETARVKGWLRRFEAGVGGGVAALNPLPRRVTWTLTGPRGNRLGSGETRVSRLGGFHLSIPLPEEMNLGACRLALTAVGAADVARVTWHHTVSVQAFRRPEFEVTVSGAPGPFVLGDTANVTLAAAYYAGGALPFAPASWHVTATPADYRPPGAPDYHFGSGHLFGVSPRAPAVRVHRRLSAATDGEGVHRLGVRFEAMAEPRPVAVSVEGRVTDLNRQTWSGVHRLLVHPADAYVGLRTGAGFVRPGEPIEVDALVVDTTGAPLVGQPVTVVLSRPARSGPGPRSEAAAEEVGRCLLESRDGPVQCRLVPRSGGPHLIEAVVTDASGRPNRTQMRTWVSGGTIPVEETADQETVTLVPERATYRPGETAQLLVQAPFFPADGIVTVRRSGLERTETFHMDGPSHIVSVPTDVPNVFVQVDLVGARAGQPAFASGRAALEVPPLDRTLSVVVRPEQAVLRPGGETTLSVAVTDAAGRPVTGAELAVVAADESVLAVSGYTLPDPIAVFYRARRDGVSAHHSRSRLLQDKARDGVLPGAPGERRLEGGGGVGLPGEALQQRALPMAAGGGGRGSGEGEAISVRQRFDALALFAPLAVTDESGRVVIPLSLPDSLTRYRVMVVAVAGETQFGSGESEVTARLPLMVRPSLPRFLNHGDQASLPVLVHNQTDTAQQVQVAVRGVNIALDAQPADGGEGVAAAGLAAVVPPGDRVEMLFRAAARWPGLAHLQVVAAAPGFADARTVSLPVLSPVGSEAFAAYGVVDSEPAVQAVAVPEGALPGFGGLSITTQSTALQSLTDAVIYLADYPHAGTEQLASRVLAVASLEAVLTAFQAKDLPPPDRLQEAVAEDVEALSKLQNRDGGFGFWGSDAPSRPYLTAHVAHALAVAGERGFPAPRETLDRLAAYLSQIEGRLPDGYSEESRLAIRAYAVYALRKLGAPAPPEKIAGLMAAGADALPLEALGWIWPSVAALGRADWGQEIRTRVENSVAETAAGAHFVTEYEDGARVMLHSERRVDGVMLDALLSVRPSHDLIPKLVRGLLGHRVQGRWQGTQENAFVLLALGRYFDAAEETAPDFTANAWVGDGLALSHVFEGRTVDQAQTTVPTDYLSKKGGAVPVTVAKRGKGRLYYRLGMTYAPADPALRPQDAGFAVTRRYEGIDTPSDVARDADGTWRVRAGARVRVTVTMATPMRRYHVALVDALPAGFEGVNPCLAVSGALPDDPRVQARHRYDWWHRPWFEHQSFDDDRVSAFSSLLFDGVHTYTYTARATTPGRFIVPPARAEEMYHPETFGRTGTDWVVVE